MPLCINQSGTYRNARTLCVNQSGTYRDIKTGCINQSATYRCFGFTAATITSFTATPSSISTGGSSTLCWIIANATNASISPTVGTISPAVTGSSIVCPTTLGNTAFTLTVGGGGANPTCTICVCQTGPALGSSYEGGFLICKASPLRWVVSPRSAEVSRNWYNRNDANTTAQSVSGCTGWFVPTISQLQNPGYICRSFWGPSPCFSSNIYWSSTERDDTFACSVRFSGGGNPYHSKYGSYCVRAFRCVTY
jgi:hypothetical protein